MYSSHHVLSIYSLHINYHLPYYCVYLIYFILDFRPVICYKTSGQSKVSRNYPDTMTRTTQQRMSIFETLSAGMAQAARPISLPERDPRDMSLILESGRVQGLVSRYITTLGARPTGTDHPAFQVPGASREKTIDILTYGNRRRDLDNATQTLLLALADERRQSQPHDVTPALYTRWFNITAVRSLSRHASRSNTQPVNDKLASAAESLLTDVADEQDPRVQEIVTHLRHGTQQGLGATTLAKSTLQQLFTSLMTDPTSRPSEPPSRPSAA